MQLEPACWVWAPSSLILLLIPSSSLFSCLSRLATLSCSMTNEGAAPLSQSASTSFTTLPFIAISLPQKPPLFSKFPVTTTKHGSFAFRLRLCRISLGYGGSVRNSVITETEQQNPTQHAVKRAYPYHEIELQWQRFWEENRTFRTPHHDLDTSKPKYYVLDMFTYPRGAGPHVGHPLGFTATDTDILLLDINACRDIMYCIQQWDGMPWTASRTICYRGTHPKLTTLRNINSFRSQVNWSHDILANLAMLLRHFQTKAYYRLENLRRA